MFICAYFFHQYVCFWFYQLFVLCVICAFIQWVCFCFVFLWCACFVNWCFCLCLYVSTICFFLLRLFVLFDVENNFWEKILGQNELIALLWYRSFTLFNYFYAFNTLYILLLYTCDNVINFSVVIRYHRSHPSRSVFLNFFRYVEPFGKPKSLRNPFATQKCLEEPLAYCKIVFGNDVSVQICILHA